MISRPLFRATSPFTLGSVQENNNIIVNIITKTKSKLKHLVPENTHTTSTEAFQLIPHPPHSTGNSRVASHFPLKNPLPLELPMKFYEVAMDISWNGTMW